MPLSDFPALVAGGDGLGRYPEPPVALRRRMAELYGVAPEQVLPTRGATHALELTLRAARLVGAKTVSGRSRHLDQLAMIYGLRRVERRGDVRIGPNVMPRDFKEAVFVVVDGSDWEFWTQPHELTCLQDGPNSVVLRSLSLAYGLAGARCGAAVASMDTIRRLEGVLEPHALPTSTVRLAELVLSPSRALAVEKRIALVHSECLRLLDVLNALPTVRHAIGGTGGLVIHVAPVDYEAVDAALRRLGVSARREPPRGFNIDVGLPDANDRILAAFGAAPSADPRRRGEAVRDTKETRIAATVDLDRAGGTRVSTGVGFFDHMLEQVAAHGGFSLTLACDGDLHIDPHHTIEDSTLAFGAALKQALGDRAGIGRYGFVAPMDEAEAAVSLDLSGRPYSVFEGTFRVERIGDYPTALTAHVFRSLADSLGAAIHVRVTGDDDHHKTEVCFKALGRALRQAVRIEGGGVPSTKGVL